MSAKDNPVVVNEPPDDGVEIGESPDGDRLSGGQARWLLTNRRKVLVGLGTLGTIAAIAEAELGGSSGGNLYGGTMALDKVYKVGERTYMGPDSMKDGVISEIPDSEGWKYEAPDTEVEYWLDDNAWQGPLGLGSSSKSAGPVYTDNVSITNHGKHADVIVRRDGDTSTVIDGDTNEVLDSGPVNDLVTFLQPVVDEYEGAGSRLHIHYASGQHRFSDTLTYKSSQLLVTGAGRNNTQVVADGDLSGDLWLVDGGGFIYDFRDLKMVGRRSSGVTATGIHAISGAEFIFHNFEARSFAQKNIFIDVDSGAWNGFYDVWSLDAGDVGIDLQGQQSTGLAEIAMEGCKIKNEDGGNHALRADEVRWLNIDGGHIAGEDAVELGRVLRGRISDVQFHSLSGQFAIHAAGSANGICERVQITDNYIESGPTYGVLLEPDCNRINIEDNRFWAAGSESSMVPVGNPENDGNGVIRGNTPEIQLDVNDLYDIPGNSAYHDGTGSLSEGFAYRDASEWKSLGDLIEHQTGAKRIETGSVNHSDPGTAADGTWETSSDDTQSVTFSQEFSSTPEVWLQVEGATDGGQPRVSNLTTTGFDSIWYWYRSDASTGTNIRWIAIGED